MTTLRDEFEAWAKERGHPLCDVIPKYGPASSAPDTVLRFSDIAWEAYQAATERAAKEALKFSVSSHMMLHAGECTAGELRTGKAIANGIAAAIRGGEGRTG